MLASVIIETSFVKLGILIARMGLFSGVSADILFVRLY